MAQLVGVREKNAPLPKTCERQDGHGGFPCRGQAAVDMRLRMPDGTHMDVVACRAHAAEQKQRDPGSVVHAYPLPGRLA